MNRSFSNPVMITLLLTPFLCCPLFSQNTISGTVQDETGSAVSFAHILLLNASDSLLVKGAVSDENGKFDFEQIANGTYLLNASIIGFSDFYSQAFSLSDPRSHFDYGIIKMLATAEELEGVELITKKPLFERQADRTVVNVQNSVTATGGTALDILAKSPGVMVNRQSGSISMNGKSGVLVMFDGKVSRLPLDVVVDMLSGMSSANIEKIELITNPPAKYDAEGDAGIINIVMKEDPDLGFNGNFGITGGYRRGEIMGANADINKRGERLKAFMNYAIRYNDFKQDWDNKSFIMNSGFEQSNISFNDRDATTKTQNFNAGLEFDLSKRSTLSLLVTAFERRWTTIDVVETTNIIAPDNTIFTLGNIDEINKSQSIEGSLIFDHSITDKQKLYLEIDYMYYFQKQPVNYNNTITINTVEDQNELISISKETPIEFLVYKADYNNELSDAFSFDVGFKGTIYAMQNDVFAERTVNSITEILPQFTSDASLDEQILSGYASAKWKPADSWEINGGLRYERTKTELSTVEDGKVVDRNFGNLFPTTTIIHDLNESNKISMTYGRRISRPGFNELAPFLFFANPTTAIGGNLNLRATITDAVSLNYQLHDWSFSAEYSNAKNTIVRFQPTLETEGDLLIYQSENLEYQRTIGFNISRSFKIASWWDFSNDLRLYLTEFKTQHLANNIKDRMNNLNYSGAINLSLPRDYSIEITGYYQSASFFGLLELKPMGQLDIGIKKTLKNNWGTLTLVGSDILHTMKFAGKVDADAENLRSEFIYDPGLRAFTLSYSKSFGNKKLNKVKIESDTEEQRSRFEN